MIIHLQFVLLISAAWLCLKVNEYFIFIRKPRKIERTFYLYNESKTNFYTFNLTKWLFICIFRTSMVQGTLLFNHKFNSLISCDVFIEQLNIPNTHFVWLSQPNAYKAQIKRNPTMILWGGRGWKGKKLLIDFSIQFYFIFLCCFTSDLWFIQPITSIWGRKKKIDDEIAAFTVSIWKSEPIHWIHWQPFNRDWCSQNAHKRT